MNGILLAGLTDHEAAAVEIMIGMNWRDERVVTLKRGLSLGVPAQTPQARACRACVLDLFGLGMRKHSSEHEAALIELLNGRSAVLLVWGQGGGWLEATPPLAHGQQVKWLKVPYTSAQLRDAIKRVKAAAEAAPAPAAASRAQAERPPEFVVTLGDEGWPDSTPPAPAKATQSSAPASEPKLPAWRRALDLADKLQAGRTEKTTAPAPARPAPLIIRPVAQPAAAAPQPPRTPVAAEPARLQPLLPQSPRPSAAPIPAAPLVRLPSDAVGLGKGALGIVARVFPQLASVPYFRFVERAIAAAGPKLLRIGPSSFVMDLHGGWLASGLPTAMLEKMLQTPHLVESIEVVPLELDQVEGAVREHFDGRFIRAQKPLDVINWELSSVALRDVVLKPGGDLTFQLRRFPNFTLLEQVGPLDVQLAPICSRMTQSLHDLLRAFPRHEQDVLRFAVLCVVSGLAVVVPPAARPTFAPANAAKQPPAATRPAARAIAQGDSAVRRGFFKSLLDKLF